MELRVKIVENGSEQHVPARMSQEAAGLDVRAALDTVVRIMPGSSEAIPLGVAVEVPVGYEVQLRPRSGLTRRGIVCGFGTIDSDYRGQLFAVLFNHSGTPHNVFHGERVAQIVVNRIEVCAPMVVHELRATERGSGGMGSTGSR